MGGQEQPSQAAPMLLFEGRRFPLEGELSLGRAEDNDIVVPDERASRHHARVVERNGVYELFDLESRHGTFLNGERIADGSRPLQPGDAIAVGERVIRFLGGSETKVASSRDLPVTGVQTVLFEDERLAIGRDAANDVVLDDPRVSRFHAEVSRTNGAVEVADLGSRNGTRLDGQPVERAQLRPGVSLGIGPFSLVFDGDSFVARDDRGALRLDAIGVAVSAKEKEILAPISLSIEPGEFVAIIGESGAGKSTLLKALAGVSGPSAGRITLNGEDLAARLTDVGYVPQDEIVHPLLTVREALRYTARLRLPQDSSSEEIEQAADRVLDELSLTEHADTRIGSLSGGQRKRAGVASELLNRPGIIFLDEPTTGLDPGLETQMMQLLRELSGSGRAVAVVTHATKNLALCDRVVVMGRGGIRAFDGPPDAVAGFFEVDDFDGIYTALPTRPPDEWRRLHESQGGGEVPGEISRAQVAAGKRPGRLRALPQLRVLVSRYLKLFLRDRRNLALLLGQAPVLALFGVALFQSGLFDRAGGSPGDAINFLFLMVITVIWLGAIDAAPEIVKERGVVERETAIGTRLRAYLSSKLIVLFGLVTAQALLYAAVLLVFRPLDASFDSYLILLGLLVATGFTSVAMGLLVSSAVSSRDQATSLIPLAVIPQLLFAGAIVPLERMAEPARTLAELVFAQWALAGIGTAVDMNERMAADPEFAQVNRFGTDFFDLGAGAAFAVQAAFLVLFVGATALLLLRSLRR